VCNPESVSAFKDEESYPNQNQTRPDSVSEDGTRLANAQCRARKYLIFFWDEPARLSESTDWKALTICTITARRSSNGWTCLRVVAFRSEAGPKVGEPDRW
jgi:hypothetical protein